MIKEKEFINIFARKPLYVDPSKPISLKNESLYDHLKLIAHGIGIHLIINNSNLYNLEELLVWLDCAQEGRYIKLPEGLIFTGQTITDQLDLIYLFQRCPCSEFFLDNVIQKFSDDIDSVHWNMICANQRLSETFLNKYISKINWNIICMYQDLSLNFILEHIKDISWNNFGLHNKISEDIIDEFKNKIDWDIYNIYKDRDIKFFQKYYNYIKWDSAIKIKLSEDIISTYHNELGINNIILYQAAPIWLLRERSNNISWPNVFANQKLSNDILIEFKDRWQNDNRSIATIYRKQTLCSEFIDEHAEILDWSYLAIFQRLSADIIDRHAHRFNDNSWNILYRHQKALRKIRNDWVEELYNKYKDRYKEKKNRGGIIQRSGI